MKSISLWIVFYNNHKNQNEMEQGQNEANKHIQFGFMNNVEHGAVYMFEFVHLMGENIHHHIL